MKPRNRSLRVPKYRHHKARDLARVNIDGKDIYLGRYNTPESRQLYDRLIAEWLLRRHDVGEKEGELLVCELIAAYLQFAQGYYVKDNTVTSEFGCILAAMRPLRSLYEDTPVNSFGPKALKALQQHLIASDISRSYINAQTKRVQRMFKWGVSEELVRPETYQALSTVGGLRKGRTKARERAPVEPVPDEIIDQTLPHLPLVVADMIRLQRLTGARPGEVCRLRVCDIDCGGDIWSYVPQSHKTEHHQKSRIVFLGPRAQRLLEVYLGQPKHC